MKIIKGVFWGLVFSGVILSAGIFIFLETFDTDSYLPQVARKASQVLARPVTIGHVGLGMSWKGIILDVGPVVIADDAKFTSQPFVTVDRVHLGLDIVSLIVRREIRITDVLVQSPEIHIIRSQEGIMNVRSIGRHFESEAIRHSEPEGRRISTIQVEGTNPRAVGPSRPWQVKISIQSIRIRDASVSFIDQSEIFPLDIWVSDINADVHDFSLTRPFQLSIAASSLSPVSNMHLGAVVSVNNPDVVISDLTFSTNLAQLDPRQVKGTSPQLAQISLPSHFTGSVSIDLAHLEIGPSQALKAQGQVKLADCVIENFDITKMVLSGTLGTISEIFALPEHLFDGALNGRLAFVLHDHAVFIEDALVQTKNFDFALQGSVDEGLDTNLQTMLTLKGDVSASLAGQVKMLEYVMDDHKRIAIPAKISGVFPHWEYKLDKDFRKKLKKAFKKEGPKQMINDVLNSISVIASEAKQSRF